MITQYSTKTRELPREWRGSICNYTNWRCDLARDEYHFQHFCSNERGRTCAIRQVIDLSGLDMTESMKGQ
ncbi:MAG: hypothetical protein Q7S06_00105 [Nanoarchaeota archaeon]|nr:hypothetical protein [Nanoarchaeota archaeon]